MQMTNRWATGWALALAVMLAAAPAQAQGKDKRKDNHKEHAEQLHRDANRREADRAHRDHDEKHREQWERENRRYDTRQNRQRNVPPGWCKGKGNPHNTPENCGRAADRRNDGRGDSRDGRYDRDGRSRGYPQAHDTFHLRHDRACRDRAAQRPLDVRYQIQVRTECKAAHDRWHQQAGVPHRVDRRW